MEIYKCNRCDRTFNNYDSLRKHVGKTHKINSVEFRVEYLLNGIWPKCGCGCGEKVEYSNEIKNFRTFKAGHQSRIKSNFENNKKAKERSIETRRKKFASGELVIWNKGLNEETSDSIKKYTESQIKTKSSERYKKLYSLHMKNLWANGKLTSKFGSDSKNWKGGKSIFQTRARSSNRLYKEWKFPILKSANFCCQSCGNSKKLHVHHNKIPFCDIIKIVVGKEDISLYSEEQIQKKIAEIVDYHIENKISGEVLCSTCHKKHHPTMNFK